MPISRSNFLFSREFRLLCLYAALLLLGVIALVLTRLFSTLRKAPPEDERDSRHKRHGKSRINVR